ncbi:PrgI family protein [Candidatus Uhrbacteria bacterium]|nr:PrgI family protein [Candidatus Uhrbacteria bacterium]
MHQFMVPQFIDVEDKIFGPITTRQFIILLATGVLDFVLFKLLSFWIFAFVGLLLLAFGGILAFYRVNGMPFHFFLLNLIQTQRRPKLKIWDKTLTDSELRELGKSVNVKTAAPPATKAPPSATKLQELALVVNTGGVFRPDDIGTAR